MKTLLRTIFLPILNVFESGTGTYKYEKSHRTALVIIGGIFLALSFVSAFFAISAAQIGGLLPFIVFFLLGLTCEIIGLLGNDRAVAKIWGSK